MAPEAAHRPVHEFASHVNTPSPAINMAFLRTSLTLMGTSVYVFPTHRTGALLISTMHETESAARAIPAFASLRVRWRSGLGVI